jgi:ATP-dependent Lon protease
LQLSGGGASTVPKDVQETDETRKSPSAPESQRVPVLPLRDVVVYPHMVIPLFVGRDKSILALDEAMRRDKQILLVAQKQADVDDPKSRDLYTVGTIATILQLLKLPDGTVKVLVEGVARAMVENMEIDGYFTADMTPLPDVEQYEEREMDVLTRSVVSHFEQYVKLNKKVPPEILTRSPASSSPGGWPTRSRPTWRSSFPRSRRCWNPRTCGPGSNRSCR